MTIRDIIAIAKTKLKNAGIVDYEYEARDLMAFLLGIDLSELLFIYNDDINFINESIVKKEKKVDNNIFSNYQNVIEKRALHYPLQYIKGFTYFYGLRFNVSKDTLIPRSDTEILVENVLNDNKDKNINILDMCTGTGCIAITLSIMGHYKNVLATDISDDALEIAKNNYEEISRINLNGSENIYFYKSDMFENIIDLTSKINIEKFDVFTCNPPYIKTGDIKNLMLDVKKYEPRIALDGDYDGLKFYRIIAKNVKKYLYDNGKVYLEIGYDEADKVQKIFEDENYDFLYKKKDLCGNERLIVFSCK